MFKINLLSPGEALEPERPEQALQDYIADQPPDKTWMCSKCGDKTRYGNVHECWAWYKEQTQENLDVGVFD